MLESIKFTDRERLSDSLTPKICQACGGWILLSNELIKKVFLRSGGLCLVVGNWPRYEQKRENGAKL
jgi:hypothetical protein